METAIRKIDNLESYKEIFSILAFVSEIRLTPHAWSTSRVGKDDFWGVSLLLNCPYAPYFILNKLVNQGNIDLELWEDSGYRSGSSVIHEYKKEGLTKEWAEAKRIEESIRHNVIANYDSKGHFDTLDIINSLDENELLTLNSITLYLNHPRAYRLAIYNNRGTLIDKSRGQIVSNLHVKGLHSLVKRQFIHFNFDLEITTCSNNIKIYTYQEWLNTNTIDE